MAEMLLAHGADPNADVYASGTPVTEAYRQRDRKMIELFERHGGVVDAATVGFHGLTERARHMLSDIAEAPIDDSGQDVAAQLLGGAVSGGGSEIVRLALERINWARDDERWFSILEEPIRRGGDLACFNIVLGCCDANIRGRGPFGLSLLHSVAGSGDHVTAEQRLAFATSLLHAGARLDVRDNLLKSTRLGVSLGSGRVGHAVPRTWRRSCGARRRALGDAGSVGKQEEPQRRTRRAQSSARASFQICLTRSPDRSSHRSRLTSPELHSVVIVNHPSTVADLESTH
jgi:hypothetical protein